MKCEIQKLSNIFCSWHKVLKPCHPKMTNILTLNPVMDTWLNSFCLHWHFSAAAIFVTKCEIQNLSNIFCSWHKVLKPCHPKMTNILTLSPVIDTWLNSFWSKRGPTSKQSNYKGAACEFNSWHFTTHCSFFKCWLLQRRNSRELRRTKGCS